MNTAAGSRSVAPWRACAGRRRSVIASSSAPACCRASLRASCGSVVMRSPGLATQAPAQRHRTRSRVHGAPDHNRSLQPRARGHRATARATASGSSGGVRSSGSSSALTAARRTTRRGRPDPQVPSRASSSRSWSAPPYVAHYRAPLRRPTRMRRRRPLSPATGRRRNTHGSILSGYRLRKRTI